jgi:iron(III) transport system ATP-binding protein
MPASAIEALDVEKSFGPNRAVRGATLRVRKGELVALLGPSGSGKTTLLRLIAGFEVPDAGRVCIGGREVAGAAAWVEPDRRRLGMVFQDGALFPHLTVAANLAFGRPRRGRAQECLELVGLAGRSSSYPHELSGGERQRVALARALAADPEAMLLDEPFAALDEGLRVGLRAEVARVLRAAGASTLLVTHNQQEALSLADQVAVLRDGRIEQVGPPEEIYDRPVNRWVAEFLGDADVLPGTAADGTVRTELGRFPADPALRGPVEVVIRPERIALSSVDDRQPVGDGTKAWVVDRSFYGHDQIVSLELAGGARVRSRVPGAQRWRPGEQVRLRVADAAVVLADGSAADPDR